METIQRNQLRALCSSQETYQKAHSILCLANAKTRPGSGFVVKNPASIPAACAYLASEQLNTGEVSLRSAMTAACVLPAEFNDTLKKLSAALNTDQDGASVNITFETLVKAYRIYPREDAMACMEDAAAALPHAHLLTERYGADVVSCATFYWVCQLMEEPAVHQRALCQAYAVDPKSFKVIVSLLDKQCDAIADQIKSWLLPKRSNAQASTSQPKPIPIPSPQKSPAKSAMARTAVKISTPTTTPSKKRTVAFSDVLPEGKSHEPFPETPTKRRRIDRSPSKPSTRSPTKASTAAFHAALQGTAKPAVESMPVAGPSTPRRPRPVGATVQRAASTPRSQQASPTRVRRRFRPVFLEQQQWCTRDPKVEQMWAVANMVFGEMVERYGHPFHGRRDGAVFGAARAC